MRRSTCHAAALHGRPGDQCRCLAQDRAPRSTRDRATRAFATPASSPAMTSPSSVFSFRRWHDPTTRGCHRAGTIPIGASPGPVLAASPSATACSMAQRSREAVNSAAMVRSSRVGGGQQGTRDRFSTRPPHDRGERKAKVAGRSAFDHPRGVRQVREAILLRWLPSDPGSEARLRSSTWRVFHVAKRAPCQSVEIAVRFDAFDEAPRRRSSRSVHPKRNAIPPRRGDRGAPSALSSMRLGLIIATDAGSALEHWLWSPRYFEPVGGGPPKARMPAAAIDVRRGSRPFP